ncbi:hypothetical protein C8Q76DRAFT_801796 [Earliella scabrosa]|nr:hypothetical protein C8Q76DRAFT_801796 [Earliella scabrosa]
MFFSVLYLSSAAEATSTISELKSTFVTITFGPASLVSFTSEPQSELVGASTSSAIIDYFSRSWTDAGLHDIARWI